MSSLNNLYISQSFQGLLHFGTNQTASANLGVIQDGLGNDLGLYLNNGGDLRTTTSISSSTIEATTLVVKNKIELTGSVDVLGSVTASNAYITNNLIVSGTISAYQINTTIESSSVIFSSGSNILGDSTADTQTLNGTIIMSGSSQLTGSMGISANFNVLGNISSSTLSGMGNVNQFVTSMQSATSSLFTSASLGLTTASVNVNVITFTKGNGTTFDLTVAPISFNSGSYTLTSSFNAYTASTNIRLNNLETTSASVNISIANLNTTTGSLNTSITNLNIATASLNSKTGSYATTGSNTFIGNQIFSGSVRGQVFPITISSNTASMDCSLGNFFTLSLPAGTTRLEATNINPGETLSLKILNQTSASVVSSSVSVKFPTGFSYIPTNISASTDIITFLSFDSSSIFAVAANYFA